MIALGIAMVASSSFRFAGGGAPELVDSIEPQVAAPVVILVDPNRNWRKFAFRYADDKELRHLIRSNTGLVGSREGFAFMPAAWPDAYIFGRSTNVVPMGGVVRAEGSHWPQKPNSDGTIHLSGRDGVLVVGKIPTTLFGKPVVVHPFYADMAVAIGTSGASAKVLLKDIAKAIGAQLVEEPDKWKFALNLKEYRERIVATLRERAIKSARDGEDPVHVADAALCADALIEVSDADLENALNAGMRSDLTVEAKPNSALMASAMRRLKAYASQTAIVGGGATSVAGIASMLDLDRPVKVVINPVTATAHLRGMVRGRPTTGIDF